jgi:hypothetical protein
MSAVEHYTSISCTTYLERIEAFRPVELADEKSHVRPDCPVWIPLKVQSRSLTKAYGHLRYIFTIGILLLLICFKWPSISCLGNEEECDDEDSCGQYQFPGPMAPAMGDANRPKRALMMVCMVTCHMRNVLRSCRKWTS